MCVENLIPGIAGIAAGNILSQGLQYVLAYAVRKMCINSLDGISISINLNVYLISTVIMLIVIIISSLVPAFAVRKLSPLEAFNATNNDRTVKKESKFKYLLEKILPTDIALGILYSIKRPGRLIITLISVSAVSFIFMLLFTFIYSTDFSIGKNGVYGQNSKYQYFLTTERNMDLKDSEFVMRNIPYIVDTITENI